MVKYTIALCNYNMCETVERSLRSILEQITDEFEVLVVDDGSTDGSIEIITELVSEYGNLRLVVSNNDNIGAARQEAIERANGEYILPQLDADDEYEDVILDFVNIYHQIESQIDKEFFLKGTSLNMAPRELLLDIPYRPLGYGEDKDLWRRLFGQQAILWIEHQSPCQTIGYDRGLINRIKITYEVTMVQFRSGISFISFLSYCLRNPSLRSVVQLLMAPVAYRSARHKGIFDLPSGYETMGMLEDRIKKHSGTLEEIEKRYKISIDRTQLSEKGRTCFFEANMMS